MRSCRPASSGLRTSARAFSATRGHRRALLTVDDVARRARAPLDVVDRISAARVRPAMESVARRYLTPGAPCNTVTLSPLVEPR